MNIFLILILFNNSFAGISEEIQSVMQNINESRFYEAGRVESDSIISGGYIAELKILNQQVPPVDSHINTIREVLNTLGKGELIKYEALWPLSYMHVYYLSAKLSNLLGFNVYLREGRRFLPNLTSLNARMKTLKKLALELGIAGAENIADISFYYSKDKEDSCNQYLERVAKCEYPIASILDGGDIAFYFHDQIHLMQLMLLKYLIDGYAKYASDALAFIEYIEDYGDKKSGKILRDIVGRWIDSELANFVVFCEQVYCEAFEAIKDITDEDEKARVYEDALRKAIKSRKDNYEQQLRDFKPISIFNYIVATNPITFSSSSAEEENTFKGKISLILKLNKVRFVDAVELRGLLDGFLYRNPEIRDTKYFENGEDLYFKTKKHIEFMRSLPENPTIQEELMLPEFAR